MRSLVAFLILLTAVSAQAADRYVRQGATGNGTGTDWTNAYKMLPATLVRGDTYYIADGSYDGYTFNTSTSGSSYIYIKKATIADHGTNVGWSDSYGDGFAEWTAWTFTTGYWDLDGQVGRWADDLPRYEGYGFIVRRTGGDNAKLIQSPSPGTNNITIRHTRAYWTNIPVTGAWGKGQDIVYLYGSNFYFQDCWFHDAGRVVFLSVGADYVTFDRCVLERNGQGQRAMKWVPDEHSEVGMFQTGADYGVVKNSYIRDWYSTGGIILYSQNKEMEFHGNVFTLTPNNYTVADANGMLNGLTAGTNSSAVVYNNTFVNINKGAYILTAGGYTRRTVKNNLFYDALRSNGSGVAIGGTRSHNWYYGSGTQTEDNIQIGTGDPFVDRVNRDYRPSAAASAADTTIGSTYRTDMLGSTRGGDGNWDRGAYEFVAGGGLLSAPTNLQTQ